MTISAKTLSKIRVALNEKLSKIGELRTFEAHYICFKAGLHYDYKTIGEAVRIIMDEMCNENRAVKKKLGCWLINNPIRSNIEYNAHPIDDVSREQAEINKRCEAARLQINGSKQEWKIIDACTDNGISLKTYIQYLKERKSNENNTVVC